MSHEEDALVSFNKALAEKRWKNLPIFSREYMLGFFLPAVLPRLLSLLAVSGSTAATFYFLNIDIFRGSAILGVAVLGGLAIILARIQRKLAHEKERFLLRSIEGYQRKTPALDYYNEVVGYFTTIIMERSSEGVAPVRERATELALCLNELEHCKKETLGNEKMHPGTKMILLDLIEEKIIGAKKEKESLESELERVEKLRANIAEEISAISTLDQVKKAMEKIRSLEKGEQASFQKMELSLLKVKEILAGVRETGILNTKS